MWIREQPDTGDEVFEASGNNSEFAERITRWDGSATPVEAALGRGVANTARTYLRLMNSAGTIYYIYIDTNALLISTVQP